eukprot:5492299-Alexandrium_andersonii.AAC.1
MWLLSAYLVVGVGGGAREGCIGAPQEGLSQFSDIYSGCNDPELEQLMKSCKQADCESSAAASSSGPSGSASSSGPS